MKKLYLYLYKRFFVYFFVVFPAFVFVGILADLIEVLRKIQILDIKKIILYMILEVPEKAYLMLPISIVIAFVLLARDLINSREIYAILINGISVRRISVVLVFLTIFLSIIQIINLELIMPDSKKKATKIYLSIKKKKNLEAKEIQIAYKTWLALENNFFMYFDVLNFKTKSGKKLIIIKLDEKNNPLFTIEGEDFKIKKKLIEIRNGRIINIPNIYDVHMVHVKEYQWPAKIDLDKIKQLIITKLPVSLTEYYKNAKIAEKYGYEYGYYWSKFYSKLATVISPFILALFSLPFLWTKKSNRLILVFVSILVYFYSVALLSSIAETGIIPYPAILIVDVVYIFIGVYFMLKLRFIEL